MPETLRLNLGAGANPLPGFVNIDRSYAKTWTLSVMPPAVDYRACDVYPLRDFMEPSRPMADESVDEVRASHILEHFSWRETLAVLTEWVRVLKPGGWLKIAVPNFRWIVEQYNTGNASGAHLEAYLMGGHVDENDRHGAIFDEPSLVNAFKQLGLVDIQHWTSEIEDCASLPVSLNLMGRKPGGEEVPPEPVSRETPQEGLTIHGWAVEGSIERKPKKVTKGEVCRRQNFLYRVDQLDCGMVHLYVPVVTDPSGVSVEHAAGFRVQKFAKQAKIEAIKTEAAKAACELIDYLILETSKIGHPDPQCAGIKIKAGEVKAMMTAPRLGFTQTASCALTALGQWGIPCETAFGVFWTHGMDDILSRHLHDGTKYLLTLDYDSVFDARDIQTLYAYMEARPDIDALVPLQSRREREEALFVGLDKEGNATVQIPREQMDDQAVMPIRHGHFGLTMIRVSALMDFPKPWFMEQTDPDGGYDDRRIDADVAFWLKWRESGRTVYLANRVAIGHIEHMIAWPSQSLRPMHQYVSDYTSDGKPEGIWR